MTLTWLWICDGCGRRRQNTIGWKTIPSWDNGSIKLHYCVTCQKRALPA